MTLNLNEVRDELMKQGYNYDFTQDDNYLHALFSEMLKRGEHFSEPEVKAIIREVLHAMIQGSIDSGELKLPEDLAQTISQYLAKNERSMDISTIPFSDDVLSESDLM